MQATTSNIKVEVHAPICSAAKEMLTPDALRFLGYLNSTFADRRGALLRARVGRQASYDGGVLPDFPTETRVHVRENEKWMCAPPPEDIRDRRVEITGPVDRKMVINGLNSGGK